MKNNFVNLTAIKKSNPSKYYNTTYKKGYSELEKTTDSNGNVWIDKTFLEKKNKKPNSTRSSQERLREYNRIKQQERRKKLKENKENK